MFPQLTKQTIDLAPRRALGTLAGLAGLLLLALLAGNSAAAPLRTPGAAPGGTPSVTSTPACCGQLASDILASCSYDPQNGTFSFPSWVAIYNPCPAPAAVTVRAYIQVTADYQNWVYVAQSTPISLIVPPGQPPATMQVTFSNVAVPTQMIMYRGSVTMYEPNSCQSYGWYAQPQTLCWPPVSPTPTATRTPTVTPSTTPACPRAWQVVSSPNPGTGHRTLSSVSAAGPNDVWAVGAYDNGTDYQTLTEHWDGTAWTVVPSASVSGAYNSLSAVTVVASNDVWAAGYYSIPNNGWQTLIEHWNGSSWSIVPSPNPSSDSELWATAATATNDVWAAGHSRGTSYDQTLVEHWNGSAWSVVATPNVGGRGNDLHGIAARTASDIWVVGSTHAGSAWSLIEHWDGSVWTIWPDAPNNYLLGAFALAPDNVWAVGDSGDGISQPTELREHFNGSAWTVVPGPQLTGGELWDVAGPAANDLWAVGYSVPYTYDVTLVEHWDGSAWTQMPSPNPAATANDLYDVTMVSANEGWAVGAAWPGGQNGANTLILHLSLACGIPTPTGTAPPTQTAASPTATRPATPARPTATPTRTATPGGCPPAWQVGSSPNPGILYRTLRGIAATSASDVWAVGSDRNLAGIYETMILHWDGSAWTAVPSPNVGTGHNYLYGVAAISSTDAWAVGYYQTGPPSSLYQTLTLHWDGSTWAVMPSPNPGSSSVYLTGVSALAANDVWAAGSYFPGGYEHTLILHWDGSAWSVVSSPSVAGWYNSLQSISARTPADIWAAGAADDTGTEQTLTEHWDGSTWTILPNPDPGQPRNVLEGVLTLAANDAWAVGGSANGDTGTGALLEHWDGSAWTIVPGPPGSAALNSVAGSAANDLWAVGIDWTGTASVTLAEHWDGSTWSLVPSPNPSSSGLNDLYGVAAVSATDVWAAGAGNENTLILHYSPVCDTPTPTGSATPRTATATPPASSTPSGVTATPPPATATRTTGPPPPPTGTPTPTPPSATHTAAATATPCAAGFSDVHPADYFYPPVLYLACHGVISGYGDGTFRPYSQTTRAQQVKIVVLGFALPLRTPAAAGYTFADVPPSFPFFAVIETAAADGIVSGYGCGGPSEPCDPQRRPYFRPYANVTRGQLSKITVAAAGWPLQNPAAGTFADVLPGAAFYPFVETAACHGVVSGYICGGPGEPCDAQRRPYFRQYNPATRGQIAKIVYGALTGNQGCVPR